MRISEEVAGKGSRIGGKDKWEEVRTIESRRCRRVMKNGKENGEE